MLDKLMILADAAPAAPAQPSGEGGMLMLVPLFVIFIAWIWFMSRTQKKQQQKRQEMIDALQKGSNVVVAGGLYGKIVEVKDKTFIVEIAKDTKVEVLKSGVNAQLNEEQAPAAATK